MKKRFQFKSLRLTAAVATFFAAVFVFSTLQLEAQVRVPFSTRSTPATIKLKGDFAMTGNSNLTLVVYGDDIQNNNNMRYVDIDSDINTFNSSSADLVFSQENGASSECSEIIYAGLYWSGRASDATTSPNVFSVTKSMPTGATQSVNQNSTVNHNGSIANSSYSLVVTRGGSTNNFFPIYTFSNGISTYAFSFTNNTGASRVTLSVNGGAATNIPVSYNNSSNTGTATLTTPYVITDGTVNLTINTLVRDSRTDRSTTQTQTAANATVNVTGTAPVFANVTKTFDKRKVLFKAPGMSSYVQKTAADDDIYYPETSDGFMYSAFVDVTADVQQYGPGSYTVADIALVEGNGGGTGYYGGWGMVVIYENYLMNWRDITIFDGHSYVAGSVTADFTIPVSGFQTAPAGQIDLKIGMMAGEGDRGISGDFFEIRNAADDAWVRLNHGGNSQNNYFNSSIFTGGNARNPTLLNNTGMDVSTYTISNPSNTVVGNGQTSTTFRYGSTQDTYIIYNITMSVNSYVPEVEGLVSVININGSSSLPSPLSAGPGEEIEYEVEIRNLGTEPVDNFVITIPMPYTGTLDESSLDTSLFFAPTPLPGNLYFDANLGPNGSVVYNFGTLPLPTNPQDLLASFRFTIRATDNCALLNEPSCLNEIPLSGTISGEGAITGFSVLNAQLITGYDVSGSCLGEPLYDPIITTIDVDPQFLIDNCTADELAGNYKFCPGTPTIPVSTVASSYPAGTRFFNEFPVNLGTSTEYTATFPAVPGSTVTYYAVPPTVDDGCVMDVNITICSAIDAVNDNGGPVNGGSGATDVVNVFDNDLLNGAAVNPTLVTLTEVTPDPTGALTLNPDGSVDVAAGTPAGIYTLTYSICENLFPANCDQAVVTVTVSAPPIVANDDSAGPIDGELGATDVLNVFGNDLLNSVAVDPNDVTLIIVTPDPNDVLTLNPDGSVDVAQGSDEGLYQLTYRICENLNPTNCDNAVVTVTVATPMIVTTTSTPTYCPGVCDGTMTANVTGNVGAVTYLWENGATTQTVTGVCAGTYSVTVTDAIGREVVSAVSVGSGPAPGISLSTTNVYCQGDNSGTITVNHLSGTGPYTYLWSNGQTTQTATGLAIGSYSVTVTDAEGCEVTASTEITEFSTLVALINTTQSTGVNDGTAEVSIYGGTSPYTIVWSTGATDVTSISGLSAGPYSVTVTDVDGNFVTESFNVLDANFIEAGAFIVNMGITPQTMANGMKPYGLVYDLVRNFNVPIKWVINQSKAKDGIDFSHNGIDYRGGTFIVEQQYRTPAVNAAIVGWQSQGVVGATSISDMTVPVYNSITGFSNVVVDEENENLVIPYFANAGIPQSIYTVGLPSDLGPCDDTYALPHADPTWADHSNLLTFNTVNRGFIWSGCHAPSVLEGIFQPGSPSVRMNFLTTNGLQCYGSNKCGSLITESHGNPTLPYAYPSQYDADPVMQFMGDLTPSTQNGSEQWYIPLTTGAWNAGTATAITTSDGAPPRQGVKLAYGYGFDNPDNGMVMYLGGHTAHNRGTVQSQVAAQRSFFNFILLAGIEKSLDLVADVPQTFLSDEATPVSVSVSGGSAPYTYAWSTSCGGVFSSATAQSPTLTFPSLAPQTKCFVTCVVTDACGRRDFISVAIGSQDLPPEPYKLTVFQVQKTSCFGECDGEIEVTTTGGTPPYTYTWTHGPTSPTVSGLCAGDYTVNVLDANGCFIDSTLNVPTEAEIILTADPVNPTCVGFTDGSASVMVSGGVAPYGFLWGTGAITQTVNNLPAGPYSVTVTDADGCSKSTTVTLTEQNCPPIAEDDIVSVPSGTSTSIPVLGNDSDPDGNLVPPVTIITPPTNGTVTPNPNGTVTYTPDPGFSGTDTFVYEICDDGAPELCDQATVSITVDNQPPVAVNDFNMTLVNTPVGGNVLTNDYDPDGNNITVNIVPVSPPSNGGLILSGNGNYTYTPNNGFTGVDSFVYEICDDGVPSLCDQATVTINVISTTPANEPPVANPDAYVTLLNTPVPGDILDNDSDPDGDDIVLNTLPVTPPSNGSVTLNSNGTMVYTPNPGFTGIDTYTYRICDDGTPSLCAQTTVTIKVRTDFNGAENDPPFAGDDAVVTNVNSPVSGNHLQNDSDPNGDNITISTTPVSGPSNGSVVINPDGTFDYTPNTDYVGPDQFVYQICDDGIPSLCAQATAYILVLDRTIDAVASDVCINDVPYMDYSITSTNFAATAPVTIEWYDLSDNLIATYANQPISGQVLWPGAVIDGLGNGLDWPGWVYANGAWSQASDGFETLIPQAKVVFSVNPTDTVIVNYPPMSPFCIARPPEGPVAVDDINSTLINIPVDGNVLTNDYSPNGANLTANTTPLTGPVNGALTLNPNGSYTYTPNLDFVGIDGFTYIVCDDNVPSLCDTALAVITVIDPSLSNDPPVANPDFYVTYEDEPVGGNVLNNDSDPDADNIIINTTQVSGPSNGSVIIGAGGIITYTPNSGYLGIDSFVYEICDDGTPSLCAQTTVTILVLPDIDDPNNNPPFAGDDFALTPMNTPVGGNILLNDYDPDGDNIVLNVTPISGPSHGTVSISPDGSYIYTPANNYTGPDNFVYQICDDGVPSLCAFATAYITVRANNNPPVAVDDINNTLVNTPVSGNVVTNDYDPDGNNLTVSTTLVSTPSNGSVTISASGAYTYTPNNNFTGTDSFVYRVCDDGQPQLCDEALVTVTVVGLTTSNDPPVANPDFYSTLVNVPVPGNITDNDADPDGNNIILNTTPLVPPVNGTVSVNANGNIVYTPNSGFIGTDVFTYQICDDGVPSLCSQTTVTVVVRDDYNGPRNDPPFAGDDAAFTPVNVPVSGNLLLNDFDPNGDNIILNTVPVVQPANGTVVIQSNGTFTYTPATDYVGPDQFVYSICDDGTPSLCAQATAYITVYPGPTLSWTVTQPLCNGQSTGSIDLSIVNATLPVSYIWSNGAITQDISNIPAGTYGVIAQDAAGSVVQASIVVTQPPVLVVTVSVQDETVVDGCNGTATANPVGGTAPYTYLWNDPANQTTQTASGLCAGIVQVTVTDVNGCLVTTSNVINPPSCDLDVIASGTAVSCNGGSNGTLLATPITVQNNAPFTYQWSNGATTQSQSGLPAGPYSVVITDAIGCQASNSFVINQPLALSLTTSTVDEQTFGGCNGSASVNVTGGTAPYQYAWTGGQTTQTATNLCPGTYTVTVTDGNGCTAQRSVTINSLSCTGFSVAINDVDLTCFQAGNGSAAAVVTGGTAPFTYLWNTGAVTPSISGLSAGVYSVTVTDNVNCVQNVDAVVTQPALLQAATAPDNVTCFGFNNGAIELTVTGGTTPYAFAWSNGAVTEDLTGLGPNTYNVVVTDANGCTVNRSAVITEPAQLAASSLNTNVTCFGGSDGAINLSVTGGLAPYLYSWTGGPATEDRTGLTAGTYAVTIVDQNGCVLNYSTTITQSTVFTPTITAGGPTTFCQGGSVVLTATAGASYLWSNGATTQSITVSASGTFNVTVTTAEGCSGTSSSVPVLVNPNPTPTATAIGPTTFCQGGSVQLTTGSFSSYLWSTGATTQNITVSTAGSYSVTVTNANGCVGASAPVNVTVNPNPTPTITPGGPTTFCQGSSVVLTASASSSYLWSTGATTQSITVTTAGSFTVTVTNANGCSGTSAPVSVAINPLPTPTVSANGPTTFCQGGGVLLTSSAANSYLWSTGQVSQSIFVSASGSYSVTVTDANGCQATSAPVAVNVNPNPAPTITPNGPTTFCQGGSVLLTASPSTSYLWNTGATTQSITVSNSGIFSVSVTNANGCTGTSSPIQVTVNTPPTATITPIGPTTFCEGGSVQLIASTGGSYSWSNGATTQSITVSTGGNYAVTVTDASGCSTLSAPVTVTVNPLPNATITAGGPTNICAGSTVTLTASAGTSYLWNTGATSQSIVVSASGSYTVTVTNANGCSRTSLPTVVTVNNLPTPTISASGPLTFCPGGSVTLTASLSNSYLWNNGATTRSITVSASGGYFVTVTDENGCVATSAPANVVVNSNPTATISANGPTALCQGQNVVLTASSGASYLWNTGATTQSITVSTAGNYTVTVTDGNGCSGTSAPTNVVVNPRPTPTVTAGGPTTFCQGGSVTLTSSVAASYLWSTGAVSQQITVSTSGSYSVTVTDVNGCTATSDPVVVNVNPLPTPTITANGPTTFCQGENVTLTASTAASYLWSTGATTQSITVSASNVYSVTVTDANGCSNTSANVTVTVNPNPTPTISASGPTVFCQGGSVTLTASVGASYLWSTGANTQSITVSASGSYSVRVTDVNGCTGISAPVIVTVNNLPTPTAIASGPTTFCAGGSVTLTASTGISWLWNTGAVTQSINVTTTGNYWVTVTDINGCSATSAPVSVNVNANPTPTITAGGPTTFCQGGSVTLTSSFALNYLWNTGATTQSITVSTNGNYSVTVTDANGCSATSLPVAVNVNLLPQPVVDVDGSPTFCAGGSVQLTSSVGTAYLWNTGATSQSITVSAAGSYSVTVTDVNGCVATSAPVNITVNPLPTPTVSTSGYSVTVTDVNGCSGVSAPVAVVVNPLPTPIITPNGATTFCLGGNVQLTASAAASYLWSTGATTQSITVSTSGIYSVTVTDVNGCSGAASPVVVTVNPLPIPLVTVSGPTTFCEGGSVILTSRPATAYLWNTGATTQSITVTTSGSYTVTVTNDNGCQATSAPVNVTVHPIPTPTVNASGPTTFCQGGSVVLGIFAPGTVTWSNGDVSALTTVTSSGQYWATYTDANGCTGNSDTVTVTVNPLPTPVIVTQGTPSFCVGDPVNLTTGVYASYLWNSGATTQGISTLTSGTFTVTVTDANGCVGVSPPVAVEINANPTPTISPNGLVEICDGESVTLTSAAADTYLWSTGETTQSIVVTVGGVYNVFATDANGCSATSSDVTVVVNPNPTPTIIASGPTDFCTGGNVVLSTQVYSSYVWSVGSVASSITVSNSGTFSVTVTDANGCVGTSPSVNVNRFGVPPVTITPSGVPTLCSGDSVELTATLASSYLWSTGATTQSIWVSTSGSYTVTITDANGCLATSSPLAVTILPLPTPTVFPFGPQQICVVLSTSQPYVSYVWSTGTVTPSILVGGSGTFTVSVTDANGCVGVSAPFNVTEYSAPPVSITTSGSPDICLGDSVQLTANLSASYLWSTGATTQSIWVSASGSYSVTVTDALGCSASSAPVNVSILPLPTPTVFPFGPQQICAGSTVTLTSTTAASYLWSTGETTQSIVVGTAGVYTLNVEDLNGCTSASVDIPVTVNPLPTPVIVANGPAEFCDGGSVVLSTSQPYVSYVWSTGTVTSNVLVNSSGIYTVTVTDANGCQGTSAPITITEYPFIPATITTSGAPTICDSDSVQLTASAGVSYLWSTGATDQSIWVASAGVYDVLVTDINGCTVQSAPINVTILNGPTPTVFPFGPQAICDGSSVTLTATNSASYLWSTGETTQSIVVTQGGLYSITVTDANGCTGSVNDIPVTVNPLPVPVIVTNGPAEFCDGGSVVLTTAIPYTSYVWSTGSVGPTITATNSGSYTVTVTDANGCQGTSAALTVTEYGVPPVSVTTSGNPAICAGDSVQLTASVAQSYLWSNGATDQSIWVSASGSYTVTITDALGCSATSSPVNVTILPLPTPTLFPFGPQFICQGQAITLTSTTATSYLWNTGATTQSIVVNQAGDYSVTVTDANGCQAVTGTVPVTVNALPVPTVVANGSLEFCQGGSVELITQTYAGYQWSTGAAQQSIIVTQPGSYTVTVLDSNGCVGVSAPVTISVNPPPTVTLVPDGPTEFCDGGSVTLTSSPGQSYSWSNGQTGQSITVVTSATYFVSVTDANGCVGQSDPVTISVYPLPNPNITASGPTEFCSTDSVRLTSSFADSYLWSTGDTTESIWVNQAGNYFVTLTNDFGCTATSSSINVLINSAPTPFIVAGGPTEFCNGGAVTLSATGAQTYLWSTGSTLPSITVAGSGTYTVTGFDANGCAGNSVPVTVTEYDVPVVSISADGPTSFCVGDSVTLTASAASSYLWNTGATTQSIVVSASGTYSVSTIDANGCPGASQGVTVFSNPLPTPVIAADGPLAFCLGDSVVLSVSGYQGYQWSNGATTSSITVYDAGQHFVTVVDGNGCAGTSAIVNTAINPDPVVTITSNTGSLDVCQGSNVVLTASQSSSYLWSTGSVSQSIQVNQGGNYTVTVTNQFGCEGSASVNVVIRPLPTPFPVIDADGPTTFCDGDSVSLAVVSTYSGYLWSTGDTTQNITVSNSGLYTVTVTNEFGCSSTASGVVVTVNPNPVPTILTTGDVVFCDGGSVVLATEVFSSYQWSTGSTSQFITVTESGDYTVTVTNSFGCSGTSDTTTVTVIELPDLEVVADGPTALCPGSSVVLTATGNGNFLWNDGQTGNNITVFLPGSYIVALTDPQTGCSNVSAPIDVTVYPVFVPSIVANGPTAFCGTGEVTLTATLGTAYLWSTGDTTQSITVNSTGVYGVIVTDANGCQGAAAETVTVLPAPVPVIVASGNPPYCDGQVITLTAALDLGGTYLWNTGATTQSVDVTESGLYSVVITNVFGCVAEAFLPIGFVPTPTVTVSVDGGGVICEGESAQLNASFTLGGTYVWSNGATGQNISVTEAGTYSVTVTNLAGCSGTSNTVQVTVQQGAKPVAGEDVSICAGQQATLTATGSTGYLWSPGGETSPSITVGPEVSTMYVVTSTAEGCGQGLTDTVWVFVSPQPVAAFEHTQANLGSVVSFTDQSTPESAITAWQWDFGNGDGSEVQNPQYTYAEEEGTYTVTLVVTTAAGCADTVSVDLEVKEFFVITDVLTPNNDGVNDYVWITSSSAKNINATIYSRWGESVWVGTGKDLRFYGKTNAGAELSAGTYYYVIQVDMGDGVVNDFSGYLTLIR